VDLLSSSMPPVSLVTLLARFILSALGVPKDFWRGTCDGFCLSSYMLAVIPVVAMDMGRGLLAPPGADLSLTPPLPDIALPGREAVEFSREMPGDLCLVLGVPLLDIPSFLAITIVGTRSVLLL